MRKNKWNAQLQSVTGRALPLQYYQKETSRKYNTGGIQQQYYTATPLIKNKLLSWILSSGNTDGPTTWRWLPAITLKVVLSEQYEPKIKGDNGGQSEEVLNS